MFELKMDTSNLGLDTAEPSKRDRVQAMLPQIANALAMEAHAHIKEEASRKLHSSRRLYVENLTWYQQDENTWVVELLKPAQWIEDGRPQGSMVDDLLNGPGKTKVGPGGRYKVIPFHHNRPPTQMTASQNNLRDVIQKVFKENGMEWGQPSQIAERDRAEGFVDSLSDQYTDLGGKPAPGALTGPELTPAQRRLTTTRLGKLDIMDAPIRMPTGQAPGSSGGGFNMPGKGNPQGHGPVGMPIQGPTGIPYLQGIKIYKSEIKTTHGDLVTQKDVMTFRTVSEKHKQEGRWMHPGFEGKKFFETGYQHIKNKWESEIKPQLEAHLKEA